MNRTSLDWSRFFKLFGAPPDPDPKEYKSLELALYAMAKEFWEKTVMSHGPEVYHHFVLEAQQQKVGGYVKYMMWVLFEKPKYLPEMSDAEGLGLDLISEILSDYMGEQLNVSGFSIPPGESELAINKAFQSIGSWSRSGLQTLLKKDYETLLKRWTPAISTILHLDAPDEGKVKAAFENILLHDPESIQGVRGTNVWMAMSVLKGP